jgi:hypothetical protein
MSPSRRVFGCILLVAGFTPTTVWKTLHRDWTPGKVRKQPFRNPYVVVDHVGGFGEPCPPEFVEIARREPATFDLDVLLGWHIFILASNAR